jgi:hypothetical protein
LQLWSSKTLVENAAEFDKPPIRELRFKEEADASEGKEVI